MRKMVTAMNIRVNLMNMKATSKADRKNVPDKKKEWIVVCEQCGKHCERRVGLPKKKQGGMTQGWPEGSRGLRAYVRCTPWCCYIFNKVNTHKFQFCARLRIFQRSKQISSSAVLEQIKAVSWILLCRCHSMIDQCTIILHWKHHVCKVLLWNAVCRLICWSMTSRFSWSLYKSQMQTWKLSVTNISNEATFHRANVHSLFPNFKFIIS